MSPIVIPEHAGLIVRAADAEVVGRPPQTIRLLADGSATHGKLSTQRVTLSSGGDGAVPHHHTHSAELFFVLRGSVQLLIGDQVQVAEEGDLAVVHEGVSHAFAAPPGAEADLLIVITPGFDRFEYFRHLARIARGELPRESLLAVQQLYDTFFESSAAWQQAREAPPPGIR